MEREQPIDGRVEPVETESTDVRRLPHLISGARASSGSDRLALASEINKVLIAMRSPGHSEEESRVIITALDEHALDGMNDEQGRSCRKEAVETLLACGFPHALNIAPEDLAFARAWKPGQLSDGEEWKSSLRRARRNGAVAVLGSQLLAQMILITTGVPGAGLILLTGLVAVMTAGWAALKEPKVEGQAAWGTVLAICALLQLISAFALGPPALIGGVGIVTGLLLALASQAAANDPPKPGDWDYRA